MARGRGDRRWTCHLELYPRDRDTLWHRPPHQTGTSDDASFLVFSRRALDGRGADERWTDRAPGLQLSLYVQRLLQLRKRLQPGVSGHESVSGAVLASTGVARGPRLCRQANYCHWKRCYGGDAGSGACQGGCPCDDAAALAQLCRYPSKQRCKGHLDVSAFAKKACRETDKMEERAVQHHHVSPRAHQTREDEGPDHKRNQAAAPSGVRRQAALYAAL